MILGKACLYVLFIFCITNAYGQAFYQSESTIASLTMNLNLQKNSEYELEGFYTPTNDYDYVTVVLFVHGNYRIKGGDLYLYDKITGCEVFRFKKYSDNSYTCIKGFPGLINFHFIKETFNAPLTNVNAAQNTTKEYDKLREDISSMPVCDSNKSGVYECETWGYMSTAVQITYYIDIDSKAKTYTIRLKNSVLSTGSAKRQGDYLINNSVLSTGSIKQQGDYLTMTDKDTRCNYYCKFENGTMRSIYIPLLYNEGVFKKK
ncbi:MAG TPA: hypothetical protein VGD89_13430 [Flavipsychrobacter sp.]